MLVGVTDNHLRGSPSSITRFKTCEGKCRATKRSIAFVDSFRISSLAEPTETLKASKPFQEETECSPHARASIRL